MYNKNQVQKNTQSKKLSTENLYEKEKPKKDESHFVPTFYKKG